MAVVTQNPQFWPRGPLGMGSGWTHPYTVEPFGGGFTSCLASEIGSKVITVLQRSSANNDPSGA